MSAIARLDGLLTDMDSQDEKFQEEYYPDEEDHLINPIEKKKDWLLKPNKNCELHDAYEEKAKEATVFDAINYDLEESGFFPYLRE